MSLPCEPLQPHLRVQGARTQMAYSLQQLFERGSVPNDLVRIIESGADEVWKQVAQVVGAP
jgi:hypothetical protein